MDLEGPRWELAGVWEGAAVVDTWCYEMETE
jgi:hypothetical protein